jgi:hypothetical protein
MMQYSCSVHIRQLCVFSGNASRTYTNNPLTIQINATAELLNHKNDSDLGTVGVGYILTVRYV